MCWGALVLDYAVHWLHRGMHGSCDRVSQVNNTTAPIHHCMSDEVSPCHTADTVAILVFLSVFLDLQVSSLQAQLHDLERLNSQLERQAAKARSLGLAASLDSGGRSPSPLGQEAAAGVGGSPNSPLAGWAGGSVNSSGPRQELTAADLAAGRSAAASPGEGSAESSIDEGEDEQSEQQLGIAQEERQAVAISVKPAPAAGSGGGLVRGLLMKFGGKSAAARSVSNEGDEDSGVSPKIVAFRPEEQPEASPVQQATEPAAAAQVVQVVQAVQTLHAEPALPQPGAGAGGSIPREAAQQLASLTAQVAAMLPADLAADYGEACDDWDKPFDLSGEEKQEFAAVLPLEMAGRPGLLMTSSHDQQVGLRH